VAGAPQEWSRFAFSQSACSRGLCARLLLPPAKLAIEVDGEAHARGDRPARDAIRDEWLASQGVRVLRYPARDVLTNLEGVVRQIIAIAIERRDRFES
jgi:very-short-patch-repair endonuclease